MNAGKINNYLNSEDDLVYLHRVDFFQLIWHQHDFLPYNDILCF